MLRTGLAATVAYEPGSRSPTGSPFPPTPPDDSHHGRFLPGTKVADRYRIVSLVGKGGMGEVYRADDLKLGHSVALKFLPKFLGNDPKRLERFLNEVRLTRQISHPNVCRVYDIGEVDGQHFLSMEYIDGEDLRILLRRIGRLPKDKGIQIAQQLCAGLAAAHDKAVLHRDLKPANIMLDGRGHVRITDFGLARLAGENETGEIAGTPAYMAPEQLARGLASVQSDLYSLGLVLYELFTGQAAQKAGSIQELLRAQEESSLSEPSRLIQDMDPAVERVILRCLEKDPEHRPRSARAVAASLPGGDPLAAALAAGETPSPEMVAAASEHGPVDPRLVALLPLLVLVGLLLHAWLNDKVSLTARNSLTYEPPVLRDEAREILTGDLGYEEAPGEIAYGYARKGRSVFFWYRQRPFGSSLWPGLGERRPGPNRPGWDIAGELGMVLSGDKRLTYFRARPPDTLHDDRTVFPPRWSAWFRPETTGCYLLGDEDATPTEGKVDNAEVFEAVDGPWLAPPDAFDTLGVWKGQHPETKSPAVVVAAAFRGKPTYFELFSAKEFKQHAADGAVKPQGDAGPGGKNQASTFFLMTFYLSLTFAALVISWRNIRWGRTDRRGALRLAIYFFVISFADFMLQARHQFSVSEYGTLISGIAFALWDTAVISVYYLALEPFVRRIWPRVLISSSKVLDGRIKVPSVGQAILAGALIGTFNPLFFKLYALIDHTFLASGPFQVSMLTLAGAPELFGAALSAHKAAFLSAFGILMVLWLSRLLTRSERLAIIPFLVVFVLLVFNMNDWSQATILVPAILLGLGVLYCLIRFGLVGLVVCYSVHSVLTSFPLTLDTSQWFFAHGLFAMVLVMALVGFGILIAKPSLAGTPDNDALRPLC